MYYLIFNDETHKCYKAESLSQITGKVAHLTKSRIYCVSDDGKIYHVMSTGAIIDGYDIVEKMS